MKAAQEEDEKAVHASEFVKAQRALKSAQKKIVNGRAAVQTASEALQDAVKAVQR